MTGADPVFAALTAPDAPFEIVSAGGMRQFGQAPATLGR